MSHLFALNLNVKLYVIIYIKKQWWATSLGKKTILNLNHVEGN